MGITEPVGEVVAKGFRFRIHHSWINGIARGGVHVISVYLKDSLGPKGENIEVIQELAALLQTINGRGSLAATGT